MELVKDIAHGVDVDASDHDLIVQVGPGAAARVAKGSNNFTSLNHLPDFNVDIIEVGVSGDDVIAMINLDGFAIGLVPSGEGYGAPCGSNDGGSYFVGNIKTLMQGSIARSGAGAITKRAGYAASGGPNGGSRENDFFVIAQIEEKLLLRDFFKGS